MTDLNLAELKGLVEAIETRLDGVPFVLLHTFVRNGRCLHVALTARLKRQAKRGRIWKTPAFLTALKNAAYGFELAHARSVGGSDGIFLLDRSFTPPNVMMRKIFASYLDKAGSGAAEIAEALDTSVAKLVAIRLVSHHLRLLGVLHRATAEDWLVLVDYDDTK